MTDNAEQEDRVIAEICWDDEEHMPYISWYANELPSPFDEGVSDDVMVGAIEQLETLKLDLEFTILLYRAALMEGTNGSVH